MIHHGADFGEHARSHDIGDKEMLAEEINLLVGQCFLEMTNRMPTSIRRMLLPEYVTGCLNTTVIERIGDP